MVMKCPLRGYIICRNWTETMEFISDSIEKNQKFSINFLDYKILFASFVQQKNYLNIF